MILFEWTLVLLLVAVLLAGAARRIGIPYPSLLALAGAGIAFMPFAPEITIEPDLALALFVAPVLLDAAFDTSPRDLKRFAGPLIWLVLVAVVLTTIAVAWVGWWFAGLPDAAAIALGAIVAPTDAVAATTVLAQFRPPRRIMLILQGESLLNDASALLIYRIAVMATAGSLTFATAAPILALSAVGSVVAGYVLARLYLIATIRIQDPPSQTVLQFVSTFGVWILADRLGLSAIITMVVYAMTLAQTAPRKMPARNRVSSYSVWETAVLVLNVLAFVLMGLQARPILIRLSGESRFDALVLGAVTLLTVVLVRFAFVLAYGTATRKSRHEDKGAAEKPGIREDLLISWCGMRGLVTLAAAFALPGNFPGRDLIVLTAFCVVLGTLVLQGLTLKPLMKVLRFAEDESVEGEVSRARVAIMGAAIAAIEGETSSAAAAVREQYAASREVAENTNRPQAATDYDKLRLKAIAGQRKALEKLRNDGTIGDEAYHRLEEEID